MHVIEYNPATSTTANTQRKGTKMELTSALTDKDNALLRIMLYGNAKQRKTWWAGAAAMQPELSVLFLECDGNYGILRNLPTEAQQRIKLIDIKDTLTNATAIEFMTYFLRATPFTWDEKEKRRLVMSDSPNATAFDASKLTPDTVLVIDSWTALVNSIALRFALENNIDLSDATKPEWEGYRWCGALANWILSQLKALNCHIIVICHADIYEKRTTKMVHGKEKTIVEFTRTQAKSISYKHAMQLPKNFMDILYFYTQGHQVKIDTNIATDRDGGCVTAPPGVYNWEDLQFTDLYAILTGNKEVQLKQSKPTAIGSLNKLLSK